MVLYLVLLSIEVFSIAFGVLVIDRFTECADDEI